MNGGIKLHLGCGSITPAGWVHMDVSWNAWLARYPVFRRFLAVFGTVPREQLRVPWNSNILIRDVRRPLPFPDRSVRAVYTSHMLDFLYLSEGKRLLKECHRVLKPQGIIRVVVEDLSAAVQEYLGERTALDLPEELKGLPPMDRLMMRILLRPEPVRGSTLYRSYHKLKDLHRRKWGYDAQSLIHHLQEAGFTHVSQRAFLDSRIDGIVEIEKKSGIFVEGIKPG
ncbi:MAG: methyltransferase domain-containing protein [Candidatus Omnitrophota bacterium]|nr:methyltransferase domain-containing protein [Candidatus Omnitrophota bacterium]